MSGTSGMNEDFSMKQIVSHKSVEKLSCCVFVFLYLAII